MQITRLKISSCYNIGAGDGEGKNEFNWKKARMQIDGWDGYIHALER